MKRTFAMLLALTIIVSLVACGIAPAEEPDGSQYNLVLQPSVSNEADASDDAASADDTVNEPTNEGKTPPASGGESTLPSNSAQATVKPEQPAEIKKPTAAPAQDAANATITESESQSGEKILIAYFTWADNTVVEDRQAAIESALKHYDAMGDRGQYSDVDAVSSASVVAPGNAAQLASFIQQEVGGDLFSIVVSDKYPSDYDECMDRAADEKAENARPALSAHVNNMDDYDIVFLGFPNWWYTLPMPVLSFVDEYDWSGKTVIPFVTHGTGGLSATVRDLTAALPDDTTVLDAIGVYRPDVPTAKEKIQTWIAGLDLEVS